MMPADPELIEIADKDYEMKQQALEVLKLRMQREEKRRLEEEAHTRAKEETVKKFFRKYESKRISHYIPCMHMPYTVGSSKLMIYFHANAEDIVLCNELLDYIRALLKVNIIAVEYPSYGIYTDTL